MCLFNFACLFSSWLISTLEILNSKVILLRVVNIPSWGIIHPFFNSVFITAEQIMIMPVDRFSAHEYFLFQPFHLLPK